MNAWETDGDLLPLRRVDVAAAWIVALLAAVAVTL